MILRTDYRAHEMFVHPARHRSAIWRFVVGMALATFAYVALNQLFFQTVYSIVGAGEDALFRDLVDGKTPVAMFLLLFSFVFMAVGVGVSARLLHARPMRSLLGPIPNLLRDFKAVSLLVLLVGAAVFLLPPWDMGDPLVSALPMGRWLILLPLSLLGVLVQVSAEEIVFRGYVQQQLAARFRSPLVWMVLPSALFALGHYLPDMAGDNALMIAVWAGIFGILMADLTARSGSLGSAIAVHFWNNVSAILIVSLPDSLSGLALYHVPFGMDDATQMRPWLLVDFAMMFVLWLAARLAIRR